MPKIDQVWWKGLNSKNKERRKNEEDYKYRSSGGGIVIGI